MAGTGRSTHSRTLAWMCIWWRRRRSVRSRIDGSRTINVTASCSAICCGRGCSPRHGSPPPQVREWRELVRYRAKLVGLRSGFKAQAHAVLAKHGVQVPMTDLFGVGGRQLLARLCADDARFHSAFGQRIESIVVLVDAFDHEINELSTTIAHLFRDHAGYRAIQRIDGIGPITAAILVAEIGDVTRFAVGRSSGVVVRAHPTTSRVRHHDQAGTDHQAGQQAGALGGDRSRPTAASRLAAAQRREQLAERRNNRKIAKVAIARRIITLTYYGLRDGHIRCLEPAA